MKNRVILMGAIAGMMGSMIGGQSIAIRANEEIEPALRLLDTNVGGGGGYRKQSRRTVAQDKRDARKARNRRRL